MPSSASGRTSGRYPLRMRFLVLLASFLVACQPQAPDLSEPDPATMARGAAALLPFKQSLQAALAEGMARGPASAIDACRLEAPRLAAAASTPEARVGRTSHRLRNPANAPADWMRPLLDFYATAPADAPPRAVALEDGRAGYVEPIRVGEVCLSCHGEQLAPSVAARIQELYPEDRATGFRLGDFRGLFWAELARSDQAVPGEGVAVPQTVGQ